MSILKGQEKKNNKVKIGLTRLWYPIFLVFLENFKALCLSKTPTTCPVQASLSHQRRSQASTHNHTPSSAPRHRIYTCSEGARGWFKLNSAISRACVGLMLRSIILNASYQLFYSRIEWSAPHTRQFTTRSRVRVTWVCHRSTYPPSYPSKNEFILSRPPSYIQKLLQHKESRYYKQIEFAIPRNKLIRNKLNTSSTIPFPTHLRHSVEKGRQI